MKENLIKVTASAAIAGVTAYFGQLLVPLIILITAMCLDYASGMVKAWAGANLSSRIGIKGIVKKVCYLLIVAVGMVADWVINAGLARVGVDGWTSYFIGLLVIIWLIVNELLSITENVAQIGVPVPEFLTKLVSKLKVATESKGEK